MSSNTNQNIIPKDCSYQCGTRIYWNTAENSYFEVFSQKKHICPNRTSNAKPTSTTTNSSSKPNYNNYYNKFPRSPKPKMSNSFEFLTGPAVETIQRKYEILSDIVTEYNGKVHGSQRDRDPKTGLIDLLVYYEVPEGKRDEVKQKFSTLVRNQMVLQK